jgi:hypothetical protein
MSLTSWLTLKKKSEFKFIPENFNITLNFLHNLCYMFQLNNVGPNVW